MKNKCKNRWMVFIATAVAIMYSTFSMGASENVGNVGGWEVWRHIDFMSDEITYLLISSGPESSYNSVPYAPKLIVNVEDIILLDKQSKYKAKVNVNLDGTLKFTRGGNSVAYRIDGGSPVADTWDAVPNRESISSGYKFVFGLMDHADFRIRVTTSFRDTIDCRFDISMLKDALKMAIQDYRKIKDSASQERPKDSRSKK